jgi:cobalt/nickel transport protein
LKRRPFWLGGLAVALLVAALLSPWASRWPDGLDRVAATLGFKQRERAEPVLRAPLPEYRVPGVRDGRLSTALAGVAGTLIVFGAASLAGYLARARKSP